MREGLEKQLLELSANLLHGVVRHQQHILDGQAEDVAGEERGEEQAHGQLVVCEVAIGANKQCVSEVFVCQELLDHRVLSFEERGVHDRIECSILGNNASVYPMGMNTFSQVCHLMTSYILLIFKLCNMLCE